MPAAVARRVNAPAFRFDGGNPSAARAAQRYAARMVVEISHETMMALRAIVVRSIREGIPPYDAARMIRPLIGLTTQQAQAVMNYRQGLIDLGLDSMRVNTLVDRYAARKLRERAETIARTETMKALNTGAREAWRQAQKTGLLGPGAVKEWITTPDERLCPVCQPMDGVQVPLGEPFRTGNGPLQGPPAHPRCRCAHSVLPEGRARRTAA